ncbi:hypothetical protein ACFFX1_10875 [Dactylosporangium sucinum]|uniref:hypothetical protein n=1 Tax=Dactylosporangium sucinum TaxID=1424081 RepID=UPI00167D5089|nr:hypothetical protein [Dactylosporangium sucinum]
MTGDHGATALLTDRLGGTPLDADRPEQARTLMLLARVWSARLGWRGRPGAARRGPGAGVRWCPRRRAGQRDVASRAARCS